ncbi:hypothetical protein WH47_11956 [Habropoda laboriosa]|uniref:Uncharacterized protein n=1 Tax=Habropoda laboriosa TaxID=597456 RepID=A0A0L7R7N3_9HYME|nr:hypothetical protein WH47_11956 [Habropoda laboriosa]
MRCLCECVRVYGVSGKDRRARSSVWDSAKDIERMFSFSNQARSAFNSGKRQVWKASNRESAKSGKCQIWKESSLESVKSGKSQVGKASSLESVKSENRQVSKASNQKNANSGKRQVWKASSRESVKSRKRQVRKMLTRESAKSGKPQVGKASSLESVKSENRQVGKASSLESWVYVNKRRTIEELKENIRAEIRRLGPETLRTVMENAVERACICEQENGGHLFTRITETNPLIIFPNKVVNNLKNICL